MKIDGEFLSNLRFADDIFQCTETPQELQQMIQELSDESRRMGLKMNITKTKVMVVDNTPINVNNVSRRAARRGQGGRLTTLNLGHVSIFYQVIFPVHKQGSIESPPRKQRLENDAKEREKQTIVAKNQLVGLIMQAVIGAHCNNFTGNRAYVASFIRCGGADSLVPRYPCSTVPMFPGTYVPRTYVPRYLCSPVPMFPDLRLTTAP